MFGRVPILVITSALAVAPLLAQSAPFSAPAPLTLAADRNRVAQRSSVDIRLLVDVSSVSGRCGEATADAVLGSYVVPVTFDPAAFRFVGSRSCGHPRFGGPPATTAPELANDNGRVTVADAAAGEATDETPTCVAILTFEALTSTGTSLFGFAGPDLSSQYLTCPNGSSAGPDPLPSAPGQLSLQLFPFLAGDASGDGALDLHDAAALTTHLGDTAHLDRDDVDGDGVVTMADVFALLRQLL